MQRYSFLFVLLAALAFVGLANAATPTIPSGIQYYVAVNITNSQSSATPSPFQQMINITESSFSSYIAYNNNFANFEYFYANGTIIPAWIESNSSGKLITWVKLTPSIAASGKLTIYLGFASKTTNLLSNSGTSGIGEAPQLSSTYAQYDDGASVFKNYWNFAGTSLPSGWTQSNGGTATWKVNNGVSVSENSGYQNVYYTTQQTLSSTGIVFDLYGSYSTSSLNTGFGMPYLNGVNQGNSAWVGYNSSTKTFTDHVFNGGTGNDVNTPVTFSTGMQVWTFYSIGSGIIVLNNYTNPTTNKNEFSTLTAYMGINQQNSATATIFVQWWRTRAVPPNGVMPSVSFGSVQVRASLTISPNPATYGQSITITATCTPSTDTCAIDYPSLGTHIAEGTGTATYTFNAFALGAGTYSYFYANDITAGINSTKATLTINQNSTYSLSIATTPSASYAYNGTGIKATYSLSTFKNQLTGTLYLNKATIASTSTSGSYTSSATAGTYAFVFNTTGNANYTAKSTNITIAINKNSTYTLSITGITTGNLQYSGVNQTATATIKTYHNQLTANLWLNNVQVGSTNSVLTYNAPYYVGPWTLTFNSLGNANYTANSISTSYGVYVPVNLYYANATSSMIKKTLAPPGLILTSIPACTNNMASGTCIGNLTYTASTTLSGNIIVIGNITINSGVTLTENGFWMETTGTFNNKGTITGGTNPKVGAGVSVPNAYAGSGGGGGSTSACGGGSAGGSTLAPGGGIGGNGATPSAPNPIYSLISQIFQIPPTYLSSAGGGNGNGCGGGGGGGGGSGVYGVAISGKTVIAGTINTQGNAGGGGYCPSSSTSGGGGGGSGGGSILIVYNSSYTAGTYSYSGGAGGGGCNGGINGGNGGAGLVITYQSKLLPFQNLFSTNYYYPLRFNATTTANNLKFNTTQILWSSFGQDIILLTNQSFSTIPLVGETSIKIQESQNNGKPVSINISYFNINTTDINSAINYSSLIQYFPILAHTPSWTAKPSSWAISLNQTKWFINGTSGVVFSTANTGTLTPYIKLNYPFTSFILNYSNNPKVQNSITIVPFNIYLANSINPNLRVIANISTYNQETFNSITTNQSWLINFNFNNYLFTKNISNSSSSRFYLMIPKSNYLNPNVMFQLNGTVTKPYFFSLTQLFCPSTVANGQSATYTIGLPDTNGTKYSFYVYTSAGTSAAQDILFINELKGTSPTGAESLVIPPSLPMAVPLETTGQEYQYIIYSPNCKDVYFKGSFVSPTNPTYLTLTSGANQAVIYNMTQATGACTLNTTTWKLFCAASDPTSQTYKYTLYVYNQTNVLGAQQLILEKNFTSSAFTYNTTLPANGTYSYEIIGYAFRNLDPVFVINSGQLLFPKAPLSTPLAGFISFILMLALIFIGVLTGKPLIITMLMGAGMFFITFIGLEAIGINTILVFIVLEAIVSIWSIKTR
ncbi:MAG: hypothetical protein RXO43_02595 [Candidatus Micrarchaeota archaeon]